LRIAATLAANGVNAQGIMLPDRLRDIWAHVLEIAIHGVRQGASFALASAQTRSGHELRFLRRSQPSDDTGILSIINDFSNEANNMALDVNARAIVQKVFPNS
jgi:hypothetical protein